MMPMRRVEMYQDAEVADSIEVEYMRMVICKTMSDVNDNTLDSLVNRLRRLYMKSEGRVDLYDLAQGMNDEGWMEDQALIDYCINRYTGW